MDKKYEMAEFTLNSNIKQEGVYILSEINDQFESLYLGVRKKEKRLYPDTEVNNLPFASESNPHKDEWRLREKSFLRFKEYLRNKDSDKNLLDLGCGNCWFSGTLAKYIDINFFCVDVNLTELKQGARIFNPKKVKFIYADVFKAYFPEDFFHYIILNASLQYFPDIKKLLERLLRLLTAKGEIHIIDSPLYSVNKVQRAKTRSAKYYSSIDSTQMSEHYHHHYYEEFLEFNTKTLYNPSSIGNKIKHLFLMKDSPFPWILVRK